MRTEIVEIFRDLHELGKVGEDRLRKITLDMLDRRAFPKLTPLSPAAIVALRAKAEVSQGVLAGYLNVAANTIGQWERGERRPTGAALRLLHLAKRDGLSMLRPVAVAAKAKVRRAAAPSGTARVQAEIPEGMSDLRELGTVDDERLRKTTLRILGRDAFPPLAPLSPAAIVALRERAGLSQGVLAGYLNVATNTVGQWERGERRPAGAALKLLHLVKRGGVAVPGEVVVTGRPGKRRTPAAPVAPVPPSRDRLERTAA